MRPLTYEEKEIERKKGFAAWRRVAIRAQQSGGGHKLPPLQRFIYDIDFVNNTAKGGTQPYGNNSDDGRFFRDPNNVTASFVPAASGLLVSVGSAGLRRSDRGHWQYPSSGTSALLQARDQSQAVWTKSANMSALKNQAGADGAANAATSLTSSAALQTSSQAVTLASSNVVFSADIKRLVGTGTLEMSIDGAAFTDITAQVGIGAYAQCFIFQLAVTNPVFTFRIGTSGDSFAVDFANHTVPANSINAPPTYRYAVGAATLFTSQSRPSAAVADALPRSLITTAQGAFGFYWQGKSTRATGAFVITGSTNVFCNVLSSGAGGAVKFSDGPGSSTTADSVWKTGFGNTNKVAGYVKADGTIKCAANGNLGSAGTGATLEVALDHFDLGTNGAGQNSIYGTNERFAMGPNLSFTDNELIAMTT